MRQGKCCRARSLPNKPQAKCPARPLKLENRVQDPGFGALAFGFSPADRLRQRLNNQEDTLVSAKAANRVSHKVESSIGAAGSTKLCVCPQLSLDFVASGFSVYPG